LRRRFIAHILFQSTATDIFSLGCVSYYLLSGGIHPFGVNPDVRDANIKNYELKAKHTDLPIFQSGNFWLIKRMLAENPKD